MSQTNIINDMVGLAVRNAINEMNMQLFAARLPWLKSALETGKLWILGAGQSNSTSVAQKTGMVTDSGIFDLRAVTPGPGPQAGPFSWQIADPNYSSGYVTGAFCGMIGDVAALVNPVITKEWEFARLFRQVFPDIEVYITHAHFSGADMSEFLDGGAVETLMAAVFPTAAALTGLTTPDIVFFDQGASDRSRPPADYVADGVTMKALWESRGYCSEDAMWLVFEYPQEVAYWSGQHQLAHALGDQARLISSIGATNIGDNLHFDAAGQELRARMAFYASIQGPVATNAANIDISTMKWALPAMSEVVDAVDSTGYEYDTANTLADADHTTWKNNGTVLAKLDAVGNMTVSNIIGDAFASSFLGYSVFSAPLGVIISTLPTSAPAFPGALWNDGGTVKIAS